MRIVIACRTFDLDDDQQIKAWERKARESALHRLERVEAKKLGDDIVKEVVESHGGVYESMSARERKLLTNPHCLYVWCAIRKWEEAPQAYDTQTDLLSEFLGRVRLAGRAGDPWARVLAGALAVGGIALAAVSWSQDPVAVPVGLFLVLIAAVFSEFSVFTVRVDEREVRWFFGRGWIGSRLPIERVRAVEARRSPCYWGWGIRWTPHGWLWRSPGLQAAWLDCDGGMHVGLGTQDPEGLAAAVESRL